MTDPNYYRALALMFSAFVCGMVFIKFNVWPGVAMAVSWAHFVALWYMAFRKRAIS